VPSAEIGRRSDGVGIDPNDRALIRLAGMLIERNDEWLVQRRYLSHHSIRLVLSPLDGSEQARSNGDTEVIELKAARAASKSPTITSYTTKRDLTVARLP
jgi:hypothetical protein